MQAHTNHQDVNTVIIGAGPAGLAVAACLKERGVPFALLERAPHVGAAWRGHYDRLHLHTSKGLSALPGLPLPRHYPKYPSRSQVIEYLEQYAAHFQLEPQFGQEVLAAERAGEQWQTRTQDRLYTSRNLVLATGYSRVPFVPDVPGRELFQGRVLHSSEYRNGRPFAGQQVLVVGFGNSGGEIAIDLHEHDARPSLSVRGPVNVVARDTLGIPTLGWSIILSKLPGSLGDALAAPLVRLTVGDVRRYGLRRASVGPIQQIKTRGRIPLLDVGTVGLIKRGALPIFPGLERFTADGVVFNDGRAQRFDAIVFATGYRPRVLDLLPGLDEAIAPDGVPQVSGRPTGVPGLYFCGFYVSPAGMLREIGIEAEKIARLIPLSSPAPPPPA